MKKKPKAISYDIATLHPAVTGSSILVTVIFPNGNKKKFLIDCGIFQEFSFEGYNNNIPFDVRNIDFAFLTHNHVDHSGRFPYIVSEGYQNEIYCTQNTKDMLATALFDCVRILENNSKFETKRKKKFVKPLYGNSDVLNTLKLTRGMEYNKPYDIDENFTVTFLGNGHLLGASCILVQIKEAECEEVNLLFTGDYKKDNLFQEVPQIPKWVKKLKLVIIQESTYGNSTSNDIKKSYDNVITKLMDENKTVISPVIACERAEQILLRLKELKDNNRIDKNVPIFLTGDLATMYFKIFLKKSQIDFVPYNLSIVSEKKSNYNSPMLENKNFNIIKEIPDIVLNDKFSKIILTTSGMGDHGKAPYYMSKLCMRDDVNLLFSCYLPPNSLGAKLQKLEAGSDYTFNIMGEKITIPINSEVISCNEFSSHAKSDELIEFLKMFPNLSGVFINHGVPNTKELYMQRLMDEIKELDFVYIMSRSIYYSLTNYEVTKIKSSKFISLDDIKQSERKNIKEQVPKKSKPKYKRHRFRLLSYTTH